MVVKDTKNYLPGGDYGLVVSEIEMVSFNCGEWGYFWQTRKYL
jgi:hypothetical protein